MLVLYSNVFVEFTLYKRDGITMYKKKANKKFILIVNILQEIKIMTTVF